MADRATSAGMKAQRMRRREEDRRRLKLTVTFDDLMSLPTDPPQYLEEQRAKHIRMLETIAETCDDPALRARICLDLLRLSSLGSRRIDLTQRHTMELPDLSHLTAEELDRLIRAGEEHQGGQGKP